MKALAQAGSARAMPGKPVRLLPRPAFLAGREDMLADLDARLTSGDGPGPQIATLHGPGVAGKTSVAVEYAYQHVGEVGLAWQFPAEVDGLPVLVVSGIAALNGTGAHLAALSLLAGSLPVVSFGLPGGAVVVTLSINPIWREFSPVGRLAV